MVDTSAHAGPQPQAVLLKFSMGDDYFNARNVGLEGANYEAVAMWKKKRVFRDSFGRLSLATALHIPAATPTRANQTRGNKNGKEDLEEGKEDRSDEAVDGSSRQEVSADCDARHLTLLQERGVKALQSFSLEKG
ncbi:MAG: hypothetical protein WAN14_02555 [Candidatus Acidiferrales bacterium]